MEYSFVRHGHVIEPTLDWGTKVARITVCCHLVRVESSCRFDIGKVATASDATLWIPGLTGRLTWLI